MTTNTTTEVYCSLQFEGIHCWPDCPIEEVSFLRDPHRHMFHVKAYKQVFHDDRDVEFIWLKRRIQEFIATEFPNALGDAPSSAFVANLGPMSCEMIANKLIDRFELSRCEVNEDNENGAIVTVNKEV